MINRRVFSLGIGAVVLSACSGGGVTRNAPASRMRSVPNSGWDAWVAGFKGQKMTVRPWDHQLRQPILIMGPQALVSLSPQDGFLHQHFPTDTLGFDEPETACRFPENTTPKTTVQR